MLLESLQDCPSLMDIYKNNKSVFDRLFKATVKKGFSFKPLKENDIMELTPKGAFKFGGTEGDKYIKLWITKDDQVGMVTWANTMIDDNFNWNAKARKAVEKRNNANLIGIDKYTKAYLKSNDAINLFAKVYMIPFDRLGNYKSFKDKTLKSIAADVAAQPAAETSTPDAVLKGVSAILDANIDHVDYSHVGWVWAFRRGKETVLWRFDKYLPYYDYGWGVKTKHIGKVNSSKGTIVIEKKGKFVPKGGTREYVDVFEGLIHDLDIQVVAQSIDDLNAGKLFTTIELKKLAAGAKVDELDLDLDGKLIDISKIDRKMLDGTAYDNSINDRTPIEWSEGNLVRYPNGCIIMKVLTKKQQLSFIECKHVKEGKRMVLKGSLIGPAFERPFNFAKNKENLPNWYIDNHYLASELSSSSIGMPEPPKLFVIAKNYNDFCKYKWYSFADNIKMIADTRDAVAADKAAAQAEKDKLTNDIKASNDAIEKEQEPYKNMSKRYIAAFDKFFKDCDAELIKMKPTSWFQIESYWERKYAELTKLIWRGNPSVVNGNIANFTGGYYAGALKGGIVDLRNLYGCPGMWYKYSYLDDSFLSKEFYKWVERGWPAEKNLYFLHPTPVIICNGGRIGIIGSARIVCENWHFSTNDGKNANGTIALKTDKIALAKTHAKSLTLYTFK